MKIDRKNPRHWWLLLKQGAYALLAAFFRPFVSKHRKHLIVLYGHQFNGNLKALYREWETSFVQHFDMFVLCLEPDSARALEQKGVQVLRCNKIHDMLFAGGATAILTDHGPHLLTPLIHFSSVRFIDVWHGVPFKGFTPEDFAPLHRYDEAWVTSETLKRAYTSEFGFDEKKVKCLGYARTDRMFSGSSTTSLFRETLGIPKDKKLVVYAPTWHHEHGAKSPLVLGQERGNFLTAVDKMCQERGAVLVVRSHLNSVAIKALPPAIVQCSQQRFADTEQLLLETDVLVADWSSIVFDYLPLKRPAIFLDVPPPFRLGKTITPNYRYGPVADNIEDLLSQLDAALAEPGQFVAANEDKYLSAEADLYDPALAGRAARSQLGRLVELCQDIDPGL
ncbi:MAG: hypothetical protein Hals2KO_39880 [Halioglobus sp.]